MVKGFMHLSSALQWQYRWYTRGKLTCSCSCLLNMGYLICSHMQQVSECVEERKKIDHTRGQRCCQPFSSQLGSIHQRWFRLMCCSPSSLVDGHVWHVASLPYRLAVRILFLVFRPYTKQNKTQTVERRWFVTTVQACQRYPQFHPRIFRCLWISKCRYIDSWQKKGNGWCFALAKGYTPYHIQKEHGP